MPKFGNNRLRMERQKALEFVTASASRRLVHEDIPVSRTTFRAAQETDERQIVLPPNVMVGSEEYKQAENALLAAGKTIASVSSSSFASTITLSTPISAEEANALVPDAFTVAKRPRARPKAINANLFNVNTYFPDLNSTCPSNSVPVQASLVDQLKGRMNPLNKGAGVMIIIWDFIPRDIKVAGNAEFSDRPGGPLVLYKNGGLTIDPHGIFTASVAAGVKAGICVKSTLLLLGINDPIDDLAVIEKLAREYKGPVVVNFSASMEFSDLIDPTEIMQVKQQCALYDAIVEKIKKDNPQIMFVCAAGNENTNLCSPPGATTIGSCKNCISWPQSRFGATSGPMLQVSATEVSPNGVRKKAVYANFGACVDFFYHGGAVCGFDSDNVRYSAWQGTSFSAPAVSSMLAAIASMDPENITRDAAITLLRNSTEELVSGVDEQTTKRFTFMPNTVITDQGRGQIKDYIAPKETEIIKTEEKIETPPSNFFVNKLKMFVFALLALSLVIWFVYRIKNRG